MLRSRAISICKGSKVLSNLDKLKMKTVSSSMYHMRYSTTSPGGSSTFKAPIPGASTTWKSVSSEANNEEYQGVFEGQEYGEQEAIKQYSEKSVNSVTLLGRVGVEPVLRGTSDHPVVAFSLATNIQYRPGGAGSGNELVKKTDWHNIVVFKPNLRESVHNYVTKGSRLMVQGRIMYGMIEDKHGNMRSTTSIVAEDVIRFA